MRTAPAAVWHRAKLEAGKPAQEAMQWQGVGVGVGGEGGPVGGRAGCRKCWEPAELFDASCVEYRELVGRS